MASKTVTITDQAGVPDIKSAAGESYFDTPVVITDVVGNYELKARDYGEQDEECCKDSLGDDLCLVTSVWGWYTQSKFILRESIPVRQCIRFIMLSCRRSTLGQYTRLMMWSCRKRKKAYRASNIVRETIGASYATLQLLACSRLQAIDRSPHPSHRSPLLGLLQDDVDPMVSVMKV
ncbi:hypothetical protein C5167_036774 [Papaver somniferum]|uniref:Uncharacterized protein n=1 Tax=Papaver somniferum TaxID=3469 RepID=A0A4Y7I8U8_PAPSO|nr:hypothetical protein C5167_036774 [Papaver somniferum]